MKKFGAKAMRYPMPVPILGTYAEDGTPDAINCTLDDMMEIV